MNLGNGAKTIANEKKLMKMITEKPRAAFSSLLFFFSWRSSGSSSSSRKKMRTDGYIMWPAASEIYNWKIFSKWRTFETDQNWHAEVFARSVSLRSKCIARACAVCRAAILPMYGECDTKRMEKERVTWQAVRFVGNNHWSTINRRRCYVCYRYTSVYRFTSVGVSETAPRHCCACGCERWTNTQPLVQTVVSADATMRNTLTFRILPVMWAMWAMWRNFVRCSGNKTERSRRSKQSHIVRMNIAHISAATARMEKQKCWLAVCRSNAYSVWLTLHPIDVEVHLFRSVRRWFNSSDAIISLTQCCTIWKLFRPILFFKGPRRRLEMVPIFPVRLYYRPYAYANQAPRAAARNINIKTAAFATATEGRFAISPHIGIAHHEMAWDTTSEI